MDADWPDTDLESDAEDVEAPPGFKAPEEQCALSVDEFANPNADVWLIRAPRDFDQAWLGDVTLKHKGNKEPDVGTVLGKCTSADGSRTFEVRVGDTAQCSTFMTLLPAAGTAKLSLGKPFARWLDVVEVVAPPPAAPLELDYKFQQVPPKQGLRVRFRPAGCSAEAGATAGVLPGEKRKARSEGSAGKEGRSKSRATDGSERKKKKRHRSKDAAGAQ